MPTSNSQPPTLTPSFSTYKHLQKQLQNEHQSLLQQRDSLLNSQHENRQLYERLDLIELFSFKSNQFNKDKYMYHLSDKFQKYIKKLATNRLCKKMGNLVWQANTMIKDKQKDEGREQEIRRENNLINYQKNQRKNVSPLSIRRSNSIHSQRYNKNQHNASNHPPLIRVSQPIHPKPSSTLKTLPTQLYPSIPNCQSQLLTPLQRSLHEQQKILFFKQLNFYMKKYHMVNQQNKYLQEHINNLHEYIVEMRLIGVGEKDQNGFDRFLESTLLLETPKPRRSCDQKNDKQKQRYEMENRHLRRQIQTYKKELEQMRRGNINLTQFNNNNNTKHDLFRQSIEQIELMKGQLSRISVNKRTCIDCEMMRIRETELESEVKRLKGEMQCEEREKEEFLGQIYKFKEKMISVLKQNEELKGKIIKLENQKQQGRRNCDIMKNKKDQSQLYSTRRSRGSSNLSIPANNNHKLTEPYKYKTRTFKYNQHSSENSQQPKSRSNSNTSSHHSNSSRISNQSNSYYRPLSSNGNLQLDSKKKQSQAFSMMMIMENCMMDYYKFNDLNGSRVNMNNLANNKCYDEPLSISKLGQRTSGYLYTRIK